jgi:transposase-like protein
LPKQHTTEEAVVNEAILVPLDLAEMHIVSQAWLADGTIRVQVMAVTTQATCPHCQKRCVKIHDTRPRKKRDLSLRGHRVELIVLKRRFRCLLCRKSFTERDTVCGWRRKTTARLREAIGTLACTQPIAHVAAATGVGPRFVQECFQTVAQQVIERKGLSTDEHQPLATPQFLGIDEFARRKGHRYDTILCDLEARQVLEVSMGRKQDEVVALLERLSDPDAVKAVSMDMSASYRPAVQLCLPKAQIVVDHFHVIQHVMKGFKKVLQSWAHKTEGKPLLEGKQALFLRAQDDLTAEQAQERTHWSTASLLGDGMAAQRRVTNLLCYRDQNDGSPGTGCLDRQSPTARTRATAQNPLRLQKLAGRNSGLFPVSAHAPFQWLCGRQE